MGFSLAPGSGSLPNDGVKSHRNRTDLIEVLAAQYPVIRRLVGDLSFCIVARRFILSEPPSIAIAPSFGDNFPRFRAADVRPLAAETLLSLRDGWLNGLYLTLHPSVGLVQSRFPIVTIWENN